MSCRSTSASSTAVSLATATSGLDESQIMSIFHELKREGKDAEAPNMEEYLAGLDKLRLRVNSELSERPNFQNRLLTRIEKARIDGPVDGATWYAIMDLNAEATTAHDRLDKTLSSLAEALDETPESMKTLFETLRKYTNKYEDQAATEKAYRFDLLKGLPKDDATSKALRRMGYQMFLQHPYPVFVYGTLRPGQGNHHMMEDAVADTFEGKVTGVGIYGAHQGFPYASEHEDPSAYVIGNVINLTDDQEGWKARQSMDHLEGFSKDHPSSSHYERILKEVEIVTPAGGRETVKAWIYLARGPSRDQLRESDRIPDGDWVEARKVYREPRPHY